MHCDVTFHLCAPSAVSIPAAIRRFGIVVSGEYKDMCKIRATSINASFLISTSFQQANSQWNSS